MLYINEKEVAPLSFPNVNGSLDFAGFAGEFPKAKEWCKDLFYYLWEKGGISTNPIVSYLR